MLAGDQLAGALRLFGRGLGWPLGFGGCGRRICRRWRDWDVAAGKRGDVTDVVSPFGAVVVGEGARVPGHGFGLAGQAGLCMLRQLEVA